MLKQKNIWQRCCKFALLLSFISYFAVIPNAFAQDVPYQAVRLNNGNPIIEPSMFSRSSDGDNINGPSLIRVPDWIPANRRANPSAQYYLYFGDHAGDYIRMAWAENIEGPYRLYNDFTNPGNRGVLDNRDDDIFLANNTRIEENHLASPDVHVDNENQRIIMYFHSGSSFFVNGDEQRRQVTWVSTSPYGLEFYDDIEPVHLGRSYFKVFEANGQLYSLDNGSNISKARDSNNPWRAPNGHDFRDRLWSGNPSGHVFQQDIPQPSSELRVRHTGVHVDGNQLLAFYSRRGEFQERIQLSTIELDDDFSRWDPTYPPKEVLTPNPGWEGGQRRLRNSETSAATNVNQLRDPDIFQDNDGQLYLLYSGNGEGGIGIARLYKTPETNITLRATADAHVRQSSSNNFGDLNGIRVSTGTNSGDQRRVYMRFDLSSISNLEHASVRLFAEDTSGGPVTVYETSSSWSENSINRDNAPSLGDPITTMYLSDDNEYYEWNITDYAKQNTNGELSIVFDVAPSNDANHEFTSIQGGRPGELLIATNVPANTASTNAPSDSSVVQIIKRNATGFALDGGNGAANGQNVYLWSESSNNVNQRWIETNQGGGFFSYRKQGTNHCIDGGNGGADRQNVYLWQCNDNNRNQHWQKINTGSGSVQLRKRNSTGFAINGRNGGARGQNVNLFDSSVSSQNLQWFIRQVD